MSGELPRVDWSEYSQIVVLTGAGISVASGLPTYRGSGGLWEEHDVGQVADREALERDPDAVWRFFARSMQAVRDARPNPAHLALARLEARLGRPVTILTQNIDGLHQRAGSGTVVELHGTLFRSRCTACDFQRGQELDVSREGAPRCPACNSALRPDVVLFGEPLPVDAERAAKKALRDCDLFLAVGTSGTVSPAASFVRWAEYAGARTILLNLEPMQPRNPAFREEYLGPAEVTLPGLVDQARGA
jgi:NAD-dependent deacetylase